MTKLYVNDEITLFNGTLQMPFSFFDQTKHDISHFYFRIPLYNNANENRRIRGVQSPFNEQK